MSQLPDAREWFYIGWLDAIWSAFSVDKPVNAPVDVQRWLIRHAYLRPRTPKDENDQRRATVTPLGMQKVIETNEALGIHRTIEKEPT